LNRNSGHASHLRLCPGFHHTGQTTENQIQGIEAAGFKVDPRRVVSETVSGSSAIEQRPGFIKLLNKLEQDDVLIVTKLDRLGRNAMTSPPRSPSSAIWACGFTASPSAGSTSPALQAA
jgi:hypothetical protein